MNSKYGTKVQWEGSTGHEVGSYNSEETQKAGKWHAQGLASCWMTGQMIKAIKKISTSKQRAVDA